jgi:hypothetical protein
MQAVLRHLAREDDRFGEMVLGRVASLPRPVDQGAVPLAEAGALDGGNVREPSWPPAEVVFGQEAVLPYGELNPQLPDHPNWMGIQLPSLHLPPERLALPVEEAEVLVLGGGTAGAPAALAAAEGGAATILVDASEDLGGTGCAGGINTYYYGLREGATSRIDALVAQTTRQLSPGSNPEDKQWNIACKQLALRNVFANAGGNAQFGTFFLACTRSGNRATGAIVAGPGGLRRIQANVTIDATGDADSLAPMAGTSEMGDPRDSSVQTHNQCSWSWNLNLVGNNIDLGCIDNRDVFDINRGIHRRHAIEADGTDFTGMPVYRESRRSRGMYRFDLRDTMLGRNHADAIAVTKTDFDQHGLQGSLYARMGFLPYHKRQFVSVVPWRVCVPAHTEGLLMAGKALSASKDAFAFLRMQPDLQNIGYATGLAAARIACARQGVQAFDPATIQPELASCGILPPERPEERVWSEEETIARLGREDQLFAVLMQDPETLGGAARKVLAAAPPAPEAARLHAAMALAWNGDPSANELLFAELDRLADLPQHSDWDEIGRPTGGYVDSPPVYWRVNQLIITLGLSGDGTALPALCALLAKTDAGGGRSEHIRLHWRRIPNCDRIVCLCTAIDHLANAAAVPALETLLDRPGIRGHACPPPEEADSDFPSAHLEVVVARTAARCGSKAGFHALLDYLPDPRAILANHAHRELAELTGQSLGWNPERWRQWISANDDMVAHPCRRYDMY